MLKFVGAILLVIAGSTAGGNAANSLARREKSLKELKMLMERIGIYLSSCRMSTEEIFSRTASCEGEYAALFSADTADITAEVAAKIRTSGLEMCGRLADHMICFGSTDLEGQLTLHSIFMTEVCEEYKKARDKRERCSGLFRAAGLSGGLIAAMLLI